MDKKITIFISSRFREFKELREKISNDRFSSMDLNIELNMLDHRGGTADTRSPSIASIEEAINSDVFILFLGESYKDNLDDSDREITYTHQEYQNAIKNGLDILAFPIGDCYNPNNRKLSTHPTFREFQDNILSNNTHTTADYTPTNYNIDEMYQKIYRSLKDFIINRVIKKHNNYSTNIKPLNREEGEFVDTIFGKLSNEIFVLLHQKHTHISSTVEQIHTKAHQRFEEHFYHFITPSTTISKSKYYATLGDKIGENIKNATQFQEAIGEIAKEHKLLLYINNFEDNTDDRALELSSAIRNLKNIYPNFHAILIGQEKLATMAYRSSATLSPLNNSIKAVFCNNATLEINNILAIIRELNPDNKEILKEYTEDKHIGYFDLYDTLKMRLFWCNIVTKGDDDRLYWRGKDTQEIISELI